MKEGLLCLCEPLSLSRKRKKSDLEKGPCPNVFNEPWFYQNGVFNNCLVKNDKGLLVEIGRGGQGVVLEGKWCNKAAALKFVRIKQNKEVKFHTHEVIAEMNEQINEIKAMNKIQGARFVKIYGHFR